MASLGRFDDGASVGKLLTSDLAMDAASDAVLLHGGMGYSMDLPRSVTSATRQSPNYEGRTNIQHVIISNAVLRP